MTPLVHKLARILPYPGDGAHWFDLGSVDGDPPDLVEILNDDKLLRLPFMRTVACAVDQKGFYCAVLAIAGEKSITLSGIVEGPVIKRHDGRFVFGQDPSRRPTRSHLYATPFTMLLTDSGLSIHPRKPDSNIQLLCLAIIAELVRRLDTATLNAFASTPDAGYTSKRRIASGRPPLRYSWRTVTVGGDPHGGNDARGGTHASPRAHSRRGHWRNLRTGKRVWVRDCRVGNPALGEVMHDYRVLPRG